MVENIYSVIQIISVLIFAGVLVFFSRRSKDAESLKIRQVLLRHRDPFLKELDRAIDLLESTKIKVTIISVTSDLDPLVPRDKNGRYRGARISYDPSHGRFTVADPAYGWGVIRHYNLI